MCDDVRGEEMIFGALRPRDREWELVINELKYYLGVPWCDRGRRPQEERGKLKCRARLAPDIGIIPLILAVSGCISTLSYCDVLVRTVTHYLLTVGS